MKAIYQTMHGRLHTTGRQTILILDETADPVYLRCALLERYGAAAILPAVLLDDWGKEIKNLALYHWIREYGFQFPRAELFGFEPNGRETQYFLRDLEIAGKYPCYAYPSLETPLGDGRLLTAVFTPDDSLTSLERGKKPVEIEPPLSQAKVSWWRGPLTAVNQIDTF